MQRSNLNKYLGVIGGGQLGKMIGLAAANLGIKSCFYDPDPNAPAKNISTLFFNEKYDNKIARRIQYSTIDIEGILASYEIDHEQEGSNKPKISTQFQTLQVYSANQLKEMLQKNGFKTIHQCDMNGSALMKNKTERILTIAKKQ